MKAMCLFGVEGFRYSLGLKKFAGRDARNPHQLELVLADVLRQSNALAHCFRLKAEEAVVMLVGE